MRANREITALLAAALLALGCGESTSVTPDGGQRDAAVHPDGPAPSRLTWSFLTVDEANAGHQPEIAQAPDGSLAVAYFRRAASAGTCTRLTPPVPVDRWDIVYALEQADGTFSTEVVTTVNLLTLEGLALSFDGGGNAGIAFMGGAEGQYRCGGSDIMLAKRSGAGQWSVTTVDTSGVATPAIAADVTCCANYQNYCNAAAQDTVGPWPGLAFCGGEALVAYRDIHFGGWAQDDEAKSDLEFARGSGGFTLATIDATCGGGTYTRMLTDDACQPVIAHYNKFSHSCDDCGRSSAGVWVTSYDGAAWHRANVVPDVSLGYKLGFARDGGRYGLAYYPPRQSRPSLEQKLWYVNSADGVLWDAPEIVDQQGDTGQSPSLAFDPAGRPAIAYYMCRNQYDPDTSDCDLGRDGLKFAVKTTVWETVLVKNDPGTYDGRYVSLAFDKTGMPAIAYQASSLDPATTEVVNALVVARAKVQ
ncbi:MAG TPA: hypothetical protein VGQ83_15560 [Polyangia bacterium]|jgi:hypothetical protein